MRTGIVLSTANRIRSYIELFSFGNLIKNRGMLYLFVFLPIKRRLDVHLKAGLTVRLYRNRHSIATFSSLLFLVGSALEIKRINKIEVELSFDLKNSFVINLDLNSEDNRNLINLMSLALKNGVSFSSKPVKFKSELRTKKNFIIYNKNSGKIIQTNDGLKFYIKYIDPEIFIETFVTGIHRLTSKKLKNKVVIDVGANCGDTAIYYANMGAKVFSFEPIAENCHAAAENIKLNSKLKRKIKFTTAAIGERDGTILIEHNSNGMDGGASLFIHSKGTIARKESPVKCLVLKTALKQYKIKKVYLLKMDCKGCEFFLNESDLKNVNAVSIEYTPFSGHRPEDLLALLSNAGFSYILYDPSALGFKEGGRIYAER